MREKLGIMGGTFDPVHFGHLFIAEEARVALGLGRVLFVPSGTPPHKSYDGMATAEERYEMVRLAIEDNPHFGITRIETDRTGNSYTLDTLMLVKNLFPGHEPYFITGTDAILDLPHWHRPYDIANAAKLVTVGRPGYARDKIAELPRELAKAIITIDSLQLDISGTDIRRRIAAGESVRYLIPESVRRYILDNGLYSYSDGEVN